MTSDLVKPKAGQRLYVMAWQPIETAPRDGKDILVTNAEVLDWWNVVSWQGPPTFTHAGWEDVESNIQYMEGAFTHWMDLPKPPRS